MKDERLTKRDEFGNADIIGVDSCELYGDLPFEQFNKVTDALNKLAQLEDEIENGTLVRLHCKVGDTAYIPWIWDNESGVATLTVKHIDMQEDNQFRVYFDLDTDIVEFEMEYREHLMSNFGKTWFTDKKQAEVKLAKLKGGK